MLNSLFASPGLIELCVHLSPNYTNLLDDAGHPTAIPEDDNGIADCD